VIEEEGELEISSLDEEPDGELTLEALAARKKEYISKTK
jgi:hypothetical protein